METIGDRIRKLREGRLLSQEAAGRCLAGPGATKAACESRIKRLEKGDQQPKEKEITALAEFFGVDVSFLLIGSTDNGMASQKKIDGLKAVESLTKIMQSEDVDVIDAIKSNLETFSKTIDLKKRVSDLESEHAKLRKEFEDQKARASKLESLILEHLAKRPEGKPERRTFNKEMAKLLSIEPREGNGGS